MPLKRRVQIIDDDATVRDALSVLLSTAGIESQSFASAEEYLDGSPRFEPGCVILDNQLSGLSGLELLKRLSEDGSEATVIMITGHGDVPTAVAAMRAGAFHFVEKPFDAEMLLLTVEEALAQTGEVGDRQGELLELKRRQALLTSREEEVLGLLVEGLPTKVIGSRLRISPRTVEHHRAAVMQKMQARTISHLVRMALVIGPPDRRQFR